MFPVSSRTGLGWWQAVCSAVGWWMKLRTTSQNRVPFPSPCLKSKAPGPAAPFVFRWLVMKAQKVETPEVGLQGLGFRV